MFAAQDPAVHEPRGVRQHSAGGVQEVLRGAG